MWHKKKKLDPLGHGEIASSDKVFINVGEQEDYL